MKKLQLVLIGCVLTCGAMASHAQSLKPGLWEMSSKMAGGLAK